MKLPRKLKKASKNFYLAKEFFQNKVFIAKMRQFGATAFNDYTFRMMTERQKPYPTTKWIRKWNGYMLALMNKVPNYEVVIQSEMPIPSSLHPCIP